MGTENQITPAPALWRAGLSVFSACAADGTEYLLWLVPSFNSEFEPRVRRPHRKVSYGAHGDEPVAPTCLVPTWWAFESGCTSVGCRCGTRKLTEVVAALSGELGEMALCAHVELATALVDRLEQCVSFPGLVEFSHVAELSSAVSMMIAEMAPLTLTSTTAVGNARS
jgi:hypothetical protein